MVDNKKPPKILKIFIAKHHAGKVLVLAALLGIQHYTFGIYTAMKERSRVFTKEFMETKFEVFHKSKMGQNTEAPFLGYPDSGAGPFARTLAYKDWFKFNCA